MKLAPAPRVLVLGTGAMACALGARLARHGRAAVTLAGSWTQALEAVAARGVRVEESGRRWSVRTQAWPLGGPLGPADVALVLVKAHATGRVAPVAGRCLLPDGIVVTLQNGLGNRETLERAAAPGRVAVGVATLGATLNGPAEVSVVSGKVILGWQAHLGPALTRFAELLRDSGVEVEVTEEVERTLWRKLTVNCAINPLAALTGRSNGGLLEAPEPAATLRRAAQEAGVIAAAHGVDLGADAAELAAQVAQATAANRCSMLQDIERGAVTEIDALNGALVEEGRKLGVPAPVNEDLWRRVRAREGRPLAAAGASV